MQKENRPIQKTELRKLFLVLRGGIPKQRREEASFSLAAFLQNRGRILSFYSIGSEIDLAPLNAILAQAGRLMANRVEHGNLVPYHVSADQELILSPFGIPEPDPAKARKAALSEIDLILVPGLAFDSQKYRLGYGKGHYDKLLSQIGDIPTLGVGFQEQLSVDPLPRDPWDLPVEELMLV